MLLFLSRFDNIPRIFFEEVKYNIRKNSDIFHARDVSKGQRIEVIRADHPSFRSAAS